MKNDKEVISDDQSDVPHKNEGLAIIQGFVVGVGVMTALVVTLGCIINLKDKKIFSIKDTLVETSNNIILGGLFCGIGDFIGTTRYNDKIDMKNIIKLLEQEKAAKSTAPSSQSFCILTYPLFLNYKARSIGKAFYTPPHNTGLLSCQWRDICGSCW